MPSPSFVVLVIAILWTAALLAAEMTRAERPDYLQGTNQLIFSAILQCLSNTHQILKCELRSCIFFNYASCSSFNSCLPYICGNRTIAYMITCFKLHIRPWANFWLQTSDPSKTHSCLPNTHTIHSSSEDYRLCADSVIHIYNLQTFTKIQPFCNFRHIFSRGFTPPPESPFSFYWG